MAIITSKSLKNKDGKTDKMLKKRARNDSLENNQLDDEKVKIQENKHEGVGDSKKKRINRITKQSKIPNKEKIKPNN